MSAKDYYEEYWTRTRLSPDTDPYASTRLALLRARLRGGETVLDAGTGEGHVLAALAAAGHPVLGLELAERAAEQTRARVPDADVRVQSAESLPWPFERESVDVVVSFEVIEHLLQPRRLLEGAHAVLRPGGRLALTTPFHGLVKNVVLAAVAFDRHFAVEGDHIRFFSEGALRRLLAETGFEVEDVVRYGRVPLLRAGMFAWARRR